MEIYMTLHHIFNLFQHILLQMNRAERTPSILCIHKYSYIHACIFLIRNIVNRVIYALTVFQRSMDSTAARRWRAFSCLLHSRKLNLSAPSFCFDFKLVPLRRRNSRSLQKPLQTNATVCIWKFTVCILSKKVQKYSTFNILNTLKLQQLIF